MPLRAKIVLGAVPTQGSELQLLGLKWEGKRRDFELFDFQKLDR